VILLLWLEELYIWRLQREEGDLLKVEADPRQQRDELEAVASYPEQEKEVIYMAIQRIRFTKDGMQVELQENNEVRELCTISYEVLEEIFVYDTTVKEHLRLLHSILPRRGTPKSIYEYQVPNTRTSIPKAFYE
jgi:hypothetical protein